MEEKKLTKNVSTQSGEAKNGKLSYEELNSACAELSQQNHQMQEYIRKANRQIQDLAEENMMKRLDYLFMVLKYSTFFDSDFVGDCAEEIKESLTIQDREDAQSKQS